MRALLLGLFAMLAGAAMADIRDAQFASIDGGVLNLADWEGRPILVVNTASQCAFTGQYEALQTLYDTYRDDGLVVLAVPSDDFRQELDSAEEVRAFCEMTFGLDLPMTDITRIKGPSAHPFYRALEAEVGFVPQWNFNKVLIGADGTLVDTWGARTTPSAPVLRGAIEAELFRE